MDKPEVIEEIRYSDPTGFIREFIDKVNQIIAAINYLLEKEEHG